jgi:adenine-specific DNA-methyltransferase
MSTSALAAYIAAEAMGDFTTLHEWGETTLDMVTGNNHYFALSPARARELGLRSSELLALSPPGSYRKVSGCNQLAEVVDYS